MSDMEDDITAGMDRIVEHALTWKARALKAEEAMRETVAALIALRDAVQKSKALESRQYVGLGIQVNQAIDRAALSKKGE